MEERKMQQAITILKMASLRQQLLVFVKQKGSAPQAMLERVSKQRWMCLKGW